MDARKLAVPVKVDVERMLCIDFNTLCDAEQAAGVSFLTSMSLPLSFHGMRAICWASWRKDDPAMTLTRAGEILQDHWQDVMGPLMEAWAAAMPVREDGDAEPDPPTPATPAG